MARSRSRSLSSSRSPPQRASPTYGNSPNKSPEKARRKSFSKSKQKSSPRCVESCKLSRVKSPGKSRRNSLGRRSPSRRRASSHRRKSSYSRRWSRSHSRRRAPKSERPERSRSKKVSARANGSSAGAPKGSQLMDEAAAVLMMKKQFELEKALPKSEETTRKAAHAAICRQKLPKSEETTRKATHAAISRQKNCHKPMTLGEPVVFDPEMGSCDGAVIFLHGLGERPTPAKEFKSLRNKFPSTKWVHLRAPKLAQPFNGKKEPSWGLVYSAECMHPGSRDHEDVDEQGIYLSAAEAVRRTVEVLHEKYGVPLGKVVICGFSQGAAVSLLTALSFPNMFVGCISLSGWLLPSAIEMLQDNRTRAPPIALCHATGDPVIGYDCAEYAASCLEESGVELDICAIDGNGHSISSRMMKLLANYVSLYLMGHRLNAE